MIGILLIDKPRGCSSHDVVHQLRKQFGTRRVGHAGTLDPLATGLLVVAVGPATRFLQYLPLEPKVYRAEITFGAATVTYDAEGEITEEHAIPEDLARLISENVKRFTGLIDQKPPMFSAVKRHGRPMYEYARRGEEIEIEPRRVHVAQFGLEKLEGQEATMLIECSGGTYVRSLGHDLGQAIGCGAFLSGLVRLRVGRFGLEAAVAPDQASNEDVMPLSEALPPMPLLKLTATEVGEVREGRQIDTGRPPGAKLVGLLEPGGDVIGVARVTADGTLQPECVIPKEAAHGPS